MSYTLDTILVAHGSKFLVQPPEKNWLESSLPVINIIAIIIFFTINITYLVRSARYDRVSRWFRDILFDPHQEEIITFFDSIINFAEKTLSLVSGVPDLSTRIQIIEQNFTSNYTQTYKTLDRHFLDMAEVFDSKLTLRLRECTRNLQDALIGEDGEFGKVLNSGNFDFQSILDVVRMHKQNFYNALMEFDNKLDPKIFGRLSPDL